ncbi:unnamed protein product [Aphis gossypii]|uniref:Uncharacterized protein n=1 Tax=Aphis gossypii TaxID=80765 RepID=A0A9P0NI54_APHGO|nr:unnamed protein product [Aphis gossypii]
MDPVDVSTEQSPRTLIEDLLNEIIETAIEAAHKEKIAIEENTATDEDTVIVEDTTIVEETVIDKETEIDSVVEAVVEGFILSVCQSSPGGGDAPEGSLAPTLVVFDIIDTETTSTEAFDENGPKGDCAAKAVTDKVS